MVIAQEKSTIATEAKTLVTLEEYRAIAETSEERYEYCNGEMIVMPGGTANHSRITVEITTWLNICTRTTNFRVYNGDMRIWIPNFNGSPGMRLISSNYSLQKSYVEGVSQTTLFSKGIITIQFLA